ncbi:hypothetical protein R1flu_015698 [Riccia fluitans]|uniref:PH domain-containing protein n=1 Tax=Riccia fluitans TaxID=41844 RepID=A0ABD1YNJ9_9MARC
MEPLERIALFDREAALTPSSRPAWMRVMKRQTAFVRYPAPKPDKLSSLEFWALDHHGILPYYMRMQVDAVPSTIFFSTIGNSWTQRSEGGRIEQLVLRGVNGREVVVTPALIRRAFGLSEEAVIDEQNGVSHPNLTAMHFHEVDEKGVRDYFKLTKDNQDLYIWVRTLARGLTVVVREYVLKFDKGQDQGVVTVDWAPALIQIVWESRTRLFGSPLNCSAAWEELDQHTCDPEQAEVLRSVHMKEAVAKDSLYDQLKLINAPQQDTTPQDTPRQEGQQQKRGRGSARPTASEAPPASRVTRGTQPPQGTSGLPRTGHARTVKQFGRTSAEKGTPERTPGTSSNHRKAGGTGH